MMNKKMMAHPKLRTKVMGRLPLITMAAILVVGLLSVVAAPVTSAYSASYCTSTMKSVSSQVPAKQAITELRGPAYATIWVNNGAVPLNAAWNIAHSKNPSWGQTEVKVEIPWGIEVNAYWVGGTFVRYAQNANCQLKMVQDYSRDSRPAKSLDAMRQWGLLSYWHVGKS